MLDFPDIAQVLLNDFEMVPVAPFITGLTFVFTFHRHYYYYYLLSPLIQGIYNYIPETNHVYGVHSVSIGHTSNDDDDDDDDNNNNNNNNNNNDNVWVPFFKKAMLSC